MRFKYFMVYISQLSASKFGFMVNIHAARRLKMTHHQSTQWILQCIMCDKRNHWIFINQKRGCPFPFCVRIVFMAHTRTLFMFVHEQIQYARARNFFFLSLLECRWSTATHDQKKKLMAIFVLFSPPVGVCHAIFAISLWINNNYIVVWWCVVRGGGVMNTFAELRINDKT